jgi:hypothetical protein
MNPHYHDTDAPGVRVIWPGEHKNVLSYNPRAMEGP